MQKIIIFSIICLSFIFSLFSYTEERGIQAVVDYLDRSVIIGKQYVFLIGINSYKEWPNLQNPVQDAFALKDILTSHYFIDEIIELYDHHATKAAIIGTFGDLQKKCGIHDSLLIFYAGHGYFDADITNTGFWVPHDGGMDTLNQANWIPNPLIRKIISKFESNHILLISDSCFAGDILELDRGTTEKPEKPTKRWIIEALKRTSRQVLTSGALEMVPDVSEFTNQLKRILLSNTDAFLDPLTIYNEIKRDVNITVPLYGVLKETDHQQGGSFFFLQKNPENIPPEPGTFLVKIDTDAMLYMNGEFYKEVSPGEWRIDDLSSGKYILKVVFSDGKSQVKEVMAGEGTVHEVTFSKAPEPASGSLVITVKAGGKLYLDNTLLAEVKKGVSGFNNIGTGTHELVLHYIDGQEEKIPVNIIKDKQSEAVFSYQPLPAKNYFSISTGFGLSYPLDYWGDVMDMGYSPFLSAGYTFGFRWGCLGIFMISGTTIQTIKPELEEGFTMYAIPVGLGTGYRTNFDIPLYAFAETAGGALISIYEFPENADQGEDTPVTSPFILAQAGIGAELSPWLNISAYFRFSWIFFTNIAFYDLSPGVRIEYNFR